MLGHFNHKSNNLFFVSARTDTTKPSAVLAPTNRHHGNTTNQPGTTTPVSIDDLIVVNMMRCSFLCHLLFVVLSVRHLVT